MTRTMVELIACSASLVVLCLFWWLAGGDDRILAVLVAGYVVFLVYAKNRIDARNRRSYFRRRNRDLDR